MMTAKRLNNKVALITGGASGIGAAAVRLFSREGACVYAVDRNEKEFSLVTADDSHSIIFLGCDVSNEAEVQVAVERVIKDTGGIDILYNNAGIGFRGLIHETTVEAWEDVQGSNLRSVFLMCKYTLPYMMASRNGVILNTSSGIGLVGSHSHHAYSASKAGVVLLTRSIALAYAKYSIRANCICPGPIETPMLDEWIKPDEPSTAREHIVASIPLGRLGRPEEVANAALFLVSDESSFITGAVLPVDGGSLA